LLRRYRLYQLKYKCCMIKHFIDDRYSNDKSVVTHDKLKCDKNIIECGDDIMDCFEEASLYQVVCIDEGQFFKNLVRFCEVLANNGSTIIVAGLDGDSHRKPFGELLQLIPLSERVTKLSAICDFENCKNNASFTFRMSDDSNIVVVGGADMYKAYCRKHYMMEQSDKIENNIHKNITNNHYC
jgi:thymidine kinase